MIDDDEEECIADDCTECECSRCEGEALEWEHWQGWHHEDGLPQFEDGCPGCEAEANGESWPP